MNDSTKLTLFTVLIPLLVIMALVYLLGAQS